MCWALKDMVTSKHISIMLQFALLHIFYSQLSYLKEKPHTLLFSSMYRYANMTLAVIFIAALALRTPSVGLEKQDAIVVLVATFIGEIIGSISYVQFLLVKIISDVYENVVKSVSVF